MRPGHRSAKRRGRVRGPRPARCRAATWLALAAATWVPAAGAATDTPVPGFDCGHAADATDRAICGDAYLAGLDRRLGDAWTQARARLHGDAQRAVLDDQRAWLRRRADCRADAGCLRGRYALRIAALQRIRDATPAWTGTWIRISGDGRLVLHAGANGGAGFRLDASSGAHAYALEGHGSGDGPAMALVADGIDGPCRLRLRRIANQLELDEIDTPFACGAPDGVGFAGRYLAQADAGDLPAPGLPELGLVDTDADDARVRDLLGEASYRRLLDTAQLVSRDEAVPGLATMRVRGLSTLMEGALYRRGDSLQVALIEDDEVRWWSSEPGTASRPPAWFDAWRARFAATPVRLMSAPGRPLLEAARGR